MRIIADTNVLVRAAIEDDEGQARLARELLRAADAVVLTLPALCEFVWVTQRGYRRTYSEVAASIRDLLAAPRTEVDRAAVEAGLTFLDAGGDFADGVIAFEGRRLGGIVFASFDRGATDLVAATGGEARLLVVDHP